MEAGSLVGARLGEADEVALVRVVAVGAAGATVADVEDASARSEASWAQLCLLEGVKGPRPPAAGSRVYALYNSAWMGGAAPSWTTTYYPAKVAAKPRSKKKKKASADVRVLFESGDVEARVLPATALVAGVLEAVPAIVRPQFLAPGHAAVVAALAARSEAGAAKKRGRDKQEEEEQQQPEAAEPPEQPEAPRKRARVESQPPPPEPEPEPVPVPEPEPVPVPEVPVELPRVDPAAVAAGGALFRPPSEEDLAAELAAASLAKTDGAREGDPLALGYVDSRGCWHAWDQDKVLSANELRSAPYVLL